MSKLRGSASVVGIGIVGPREAENASHLELLGTSVIRALNDAGLRMQDIDGLFTATAQNRLTPVAVADYLGIHPVFMDGTNTGGASFGGFALSAAMALRLGLCRVALICYGSNARSGPKRGVPRAEPDWIEESARPKFPISDYALAAARYMYEFGTTREQLAEVAVAARAWACLNPEAQERGPLTIEDVLTSKAVADPLTVRDCCIISDGAGAVLMMRTDEARSRPHEPISLLGAGIGQSHCSISAMKDLTVTAARESGARAFSMAGLQVRDIDVVQIYDAFTINTILFLEDLGFCEKGEGGRFVEGGTIAPGGRLPVNTNGGGLSCIHPGMYGIFSIIEAVRQLRGSAGQRQVAGARTALCHANGYVLSTQATTIWGIGEAL